MSVQDASALVGGRYEIQRVVIDTHAPTSVRLELSSANGTAVVLLSGVVDLRLKQATSNWPFTMNFIDVSDRQMEDIGVQVSDCHTDALSCFCSSVDVTVDSQS